MDTKYIREDLTNFMVYFYKSELFDIVTKDRTNVIFSTSFTKMSS